MVIDHLSTYIDGGAATAAIRLHESLVSAGIRSRFWYARRHVNRPPADAYQIRWPADKGNPLARLAAGISATVRKRLLHWELSRSFSGRGKCTEVFTTPFYAGPTPLDRQQLDGDLLHLHWVSYLLDYPSFFASLPPELPVVWTLHDMNPFTGGCHFAGDCTAFETQCHSCPQLDIRGPRDLSQRSFQVKQRALAGKNLHLVAPSHWLAEQARRSRIFAGTKSVRVIPYGLDTDRFAPVNKAAAKQKLGLPQDRLVIGFGAASVEHHRKGFRELLAAFGRLGNKSRVLGLVFGGGALPACNFELPEIRSVGFVKDAARQALVYSAADLFVLPSLQDNLPQTGLEAIACGTPVVGFEIGGVPDFVHHGQTGLLAKRGDAADLAANIERLLGHPAEREQMGRNARELALSEFRSERQAERYAELYRSLLVPQRQREAA